MSEPTSVLPSIPSLSFVERGKSVAVSGGVTTLRTSGGLEDSTAIIALSGKGIAIWNVAGSDPEDDGNLPGMDGDFARSAVNATLFCVVFGSSAKNFETSITATIEKYLNGLNGRVRILWYKDGTYEAVSVNGQGSITLSTKMAGGSSVPKKKDNVGPSMNLQSNHYTEEYKFSQTNTFPDIDQLVISEGGVCTVCSTDWLLAKVDGKAFVFSEQTVYEKARQVDKAMKENKGGNALYTMPLESKMKYEEYHSIKPDLDGGSDIVKVLEKYPYTVIKISSRSDGQGQSHALSVCKIDTTFYMFDPNFGSFKTKKGNGVKHWWNDVIHYTRQNKPDGYKRYTDWAEGFFIYCFSPKKE